MWTHIAVGVISVGGAAVVVGALLLVAGHPPLQAYHGIVVSSFGGPVAWARTLVSATPLIFTAIGAAVAFRARIWNIGQDGQLMIGAVVASWVALFFGSRLPGPVVITLVLIGGALGGALWAAIAAVPKGRFGTDEVISTLMLNFIAIHVMNYLIFGSISYWRDTSNVTFPSGREIPASTILPQIWLRLHIGFVVAVALAIVLWFVLRSSRWGFDVRVIGDSIPAAHYAGIRVARRMTGIFLLSGMMAGLGGAVEVGGTTFALNPTSFSSGVGYTGIVVAVVAGLNPIAIVIVSVLVAGFTNAGTSLQALGVPGQVVTLLQGLALLFVAGAEFFRRNRVSFVRPRDEETTRDALSKVAA